MRKIYIDPGHGGNDPGAVKGARREKDDVLRLSLLLDAALGEQGVAVKLSRTGDTNPGGRTAQANAWGADYYLSIHRNSAGASATGNEIWVARNASQSTIQAARAILDAVCAVDGLPDRGVKKGAVGYTDYGVNRDTNMPSALLELGFISNDKDNAAFDRCIEQYATAITKALCGIVGATYKDPGRKELYRVRKAWSDISSQIGAYTVLDNAKTATRPGYAVFDTTGKAVYTHPRLPGDIDGDGKVTVKDVRLAMRHMAKLVTLTAEQAQAADMDGDGKVTLADIREISRIVARLT